MERLNGWLELLWKDLQGAMRHLKELQVFVKVYDNEEIIKILTDESMRARNADIAWYGDARLTGFSGGVPVIVNGNVVGAVAVSGLTEDEDVALAAIGVAAIGGTAPGA